MLLAAIAKRPRGAKPDLHQTEIAAIDGARIEIAFPPDDEPHQLHRQAVGLGMLDDQDLDRRSLLGHLRLGHLRLGRLPLDRGCRLRQCAHHRQQTKRDRAPHRPMTPKPSPKCADGALL
jgi:hypothetical protein